MYSKRLEFLFKEFKIVTESEILSFGDIEYLDTHDPITQKQIIIAIRETDDSNFRITQEVFDMLIGCDPTKNKIYVQWLLNVLTKLFKKKEKDLISKIISEDLDMINYSINKFDSLKKTKEFKRLSINNYSISHIENPSDINQYKLPEELNGAIFPFEETSSEGLELKLKMYVKSKDGLIPFEDKNFLIFIPLNIKASIAFNGLASWCTTRPGNGMYKHYTNNRRPNGKLSRLFVVMNKNTHDIMQIHFETFQINDYRNSNNPTKFVTEFLENSIGLSNYFKAFLMDNIIISNYKTHTNYFRAIKVFNFIDSLINMYPSDQEIIDFSGTKTRNLSIKFFPKLKILKLIDLGIESFPEMELGSNIEIISLYKNKLTEFPNEILKLKNIRSINLSENKITNIPDNIQYLGPKFNGKLINLSLKNNNLSISEKSRLVELLPGVNLTL